jgi:hypothetical protein
MSVTITASSVLSQNGMSTTDFAAADVEAMIDDAIDTVDLFAWQSMAAMTGTAGAKTVTITRLQSPAVKMLISLLLRENKKTQFSSATNTSGSTSTSKSVSIAGVLSQSEGSSISTAISASAAINNPANTVFVQYFLQACEELKKQTATITNSPATLPIYVGQDLSGLT